jgi:hypothetical protein
MMESVAAIITVREAEPGLTRWGFWSRSRDGFEAARQEMTCADAIDEFLRAAEFLTEHCQRRKSVARHISYGWKHRAEAWHREVKQKWENPYVSNGMFIAAALANGFAIERIAGSPNCRLTISNRSWSLENER